MFLIRSGYKAASQVLKNTVISPDFLMWKFCEKAPKTMRKLCLSTKFSHQQIGEITVFFRREVLKKTQSNSLLIKIFKSDRSFFPLSKLRSSHPEVFLGKGVLKICSKFIGEHPCRSVISINSQSSFIEIALQYGCSPENLLHIFRTPFPKSTSGRLLLKAFSGLISPLPLFILTSKY